MLRLMDDQDDVTGPFLPEETAIALTTALVQHRAALVFAFSKRSAFRHTPSRQVFTSSIPAISSPGLQLALVVEMSGS